MKNKNYLREEIKNLSSILSEEKHDMEELLRRGTGNEIVEAGRDWPKGTFDYKRGFEALLEEPNSDGYWIFYAGKDWPKENFDYKKGLEFLSNKTDLIYLVKAGEEWPEFDYEKGFDILVEKDESGRFFNYAGSYWPVFNFTKGFHHLIQRDKDGGYIFSAGNNWRRFDYPKAFRALMKISLRKQGGSIYYYDALQNWPKEEVTKEEERTEKNSHGNASFERAQQSLKRKEEKMKKKHSLREDLLNLANILKETHYSDAEEAMSTHKLLKKYKKSKLSLTKGMKRIERLEDDGLYTLRAGKEWKYFDYNKGLDILAKKGRKANRVYEAGMSWKEFDFKKGQEILEKKDIDGKHIYLAGAHWEKFDNKKGFEALLKKDQTGEFIALASDEWKKFNHKKALDALIKIDKTGKWVYKMGMNINVLEGGWKEAEYRKAFDHLMKVGDAYYIRAAGSNFWLYFDFEKAISVLRKIDRTGKYTALALIEWITVLGDKTVEEVEKEFPEQVKRARKNTGPLSFIARKNRNWS